MQIQMNKIRQIDVGREIAKCVEEWRSGNLIASFAETKQLSAQEKAEIRELLDGMA